MQIYILFFTRNIFPTFFCLKSKKLYYRPLDEFNIFDATGAKFHFAPTGFQFHRMEFTFRPMELASQAIERMFHPLERKTYRVRPATEQGKKINT